MIKWKDESNQILVGVNKWNDESKVSNKYKYNDEYGLYMSWWNCIYGDIQLASHTPNILNQRSHFQGTNQQPVLLKTLQRAIIDGQYYMLKNDWTIKDEWNVSWNGTIEDDAKLPTKSPTSNFNQILLSPSSGLLDMKTYSITSYNQPKNSATET